MTAKLVQSNDAFNLLHLYELRYFSKQLTDNVDSPLIVREEWNKAIYELSLFTQQSSNQELVLCIIKQFELTYPGKKYKSDWIAFLAESKIEDFTNIDIETIYVSTMHKAKGKEFDNVFLMLNNVDIEADQNRKLIYVAITRAKKNLFIHYHGKYFKSIIAENLSYIYNVNEYPEPKEIALYLTHKDVRLGYCCICAKKNESRCEVAPF